MTYHIITVVHVDATFLLGSVPGNCDTQVHLTVAVLTTPLLPPNYLRMDNKTTQPSSAQQVKKAKENNYKNMYQYDVLVATFLAALTVTLLSYANDVATQRGNGSDQVNPITKISWLLAVWLNLLSILISVMLDECVAALEPMLKRFGAKKVAVFLKKGLEVGAHGMMTSGMISLIVGFVAHVWKEQNQNLGIAMVVLFGVMPFWLIFLALGQAASAIVLEEFEEEP
ncbi:hypothetical protein BDV93DRAFT_514324 [Ceratobasidium sp. AG-I]|nr:hypothetical protein BDV93DRAFT_514324 [Ceratobasidium sp. AG-I]